MAFGTLKADTLTHSTAGSLTTDYVVNGSAKVLVYGDTDASVLSSENVSSSSDDGTGQYTYTFTNALNDALFYAAGSSENGAVIFSINQTSGKTTTTCTVRNVTHADVDYDVKHHLTVHGDLA